MKLISHIVQEVPLDANLATAPPKPSTSRFKSERVAGSTLASHSLGDAVLPAAQSTSVQRAVRMGKLEDGQLVGGDAGDSDGELDTADENTRAMLEMLRNGKVTNIGPRPAAVPGSPAANELPGSTSTKVPSAADKVPPPQAVAQPQPSKVSKFKLAVTHPSTPSSHAQPSGSGLSSSLSTPVNTADRSSPKFPSPGDSTPDHQLASSSTPTVTKSLSMPSMIVDSPDFPRPAGAQMPSMIVESPDFPRPAFANRSAGSTPTALSPTSTIVPSTQSSPVAPVTMRPSVVERRPPTVVSAREASGSAGASGESGARKPKVSRFKAQRGQ